jgi:hypothetical protein
MRYWQVITHRDKTHAVVGYSVERAVRLEAVGGTAWRPVRQVAQHFGPTERLRALVLRGRLIREQVGLPAWE